MDELQTYKQAQEYLEQQLQERGVELETDGLYPNMYFRELRNNSINFVATASSKGDKPLDGEGKKLLGQVNESLEQFDAHRQKTKRPSIEDLF